MIMIRFLKLRSTLLLAINVLQFEHVIVQLFSFLFYFIVAVISQMDRTEGIVSHALTGEKSSLSTATRIKAPKWSNIQISPTAQKEISEKIKTLSK
jgi:hypothetical protein